MKEKTFKDLKETDVVYYIDVENKKIYEQRLDDERFGLSSNGFRLPEQGNHMDGHGIPSCITVQDAPVDANATAVRRNRKTYYFNYEAAAYELSRKVDEVISIADYNYKKAKKEYEDILNKYKEKEEECKQLKVGSVISTWYMGGDKEVVESIIHNDKSDFRNEGDGKRITINGFYWDADDIDIIKL